MEKCTLAIFELIKSTVFEDKYGAMKNYRLILQRQVCWHHLAEKVKSYKVTSEEITSLKEEFELELTQKWDQQTNLTHYTLAKMTKFSKEEIKAIQEKFLDMKKENGLSETDGLSYEVFLALITSIATERGISIREEIYCKIFEYFDMNKDNNMDFKEFLCCTSLLLRGNLPEKIDFCFKINDQGSKGYLKGEEFESFLELLTRMASIFKDEDEMEYFDRDITKFKAQAQEIFNNTQKFRPIHVQELMQTEFIERLQGVYAGRRRKETARLIGKNFRGAYVKRSEGEIYVGDLNPNEDVRVSGQADGGGQLSGGKAPEESKKQDSKTESPESLRGSLKPSVSTGEDSAPRRKITGDSNDEMSDLARESYIKPEIFTDTNPHTKQYNNHLKKRRGDPDENYSTQSCNVCRIF